MKIAIIGYGHVGQATHELFKDAVIFDEPKNIGSRKAVNSCDAAFVCVPTPQNSNGSCDTQIVENVLEWLDTKIIILRSTVYVGFTDAMMKKYGKEIVFQPEYYGETVAHPFANLNDRTWLSFGGTKQGINLAIDVYKTVINSNVRIYQADAKSVEMAKYMENAFLALKVTFCNEMYDIANALGADYNQAREVWIADPRIGSSHTFVYNNNRGYGGSCLPKDVASIINQADVAKTDATLMKAVVKKNSLLTSAKKMNNQPEKEPYYSALIGIGYAPLDYSKKHYVFKKSDRIIKIARSEYNCADINESFFIEKCAHDILLKANFPIAEIYRIYGNNELVSDFCVLEEEYCDGDVYYSKDIADDLLLQIWNKVFEATQLTSSIYGFIDGSGKAPFTGWRDFLRFIAAHASAEKDLLTNGISACPNVTKGSFLFTDINTANFIFRNNILSKIIDVERPIYGDPLMLYAMAKIRNPKLYSLIKLQQNVEIIEYYCTVYKHLFDYIKTK